MESGRSETHNMENVIEHDLNKKYNNINDAYRSRISRRFGARSDSMSPVFLGGGLKDSTSFLLPKIESGRLGEMRGRFPDALERDASGRPLVDGERPDAEADEQYYSAISLQHQLNADLTNQLTGSRSNLSLDQNQWNKDFLGRVDQLKRQYLKKEARERTDKKGKISPGRNNFEELSRQFSQSSVGAI